MKKLWLIVLVLICLLGFAGCDPGADAIDGEELRSNTVKIELYQYENPDPKLIRGNKMNKAVIDLDNATLLGTLDESCFEDLINEIDGYETLVFGRILNEPIGKTLVLYQSDGNLVVLFGCVYQEKTGVKRYYGQCNIYDENGKFVWDYGDISHKLVDTLAAKYFESVK